MDIRDAEPVDSILMIGFGGPGRPDDVMPFLRIVVEGRNVPEERLREVAHHYEVVGGRSPYNDLTLAQARDLERWLARHGHPLPVYVGMRNWHPFLADTIRRMNAEGRRHAAAVILAAHRSEPSWQRYMQDVSRAIDAEGAGPKISYVAPWFDAGGFLEASAQCLELIGGIQRGDWPEDLALIFTAHSIPLPLARSSSYVADLQASCEGVAGLLGIPADRWQLAYQSRSGDGRMPWLGPDILEVLRQAEARGVRRVVVQAIGFIIDHVEVLYDLDLEAAAVASDLGIEFRRAPCVNSHPEFVAMLGDRILRLAGGAD
jgi:ferrochelatase